MITDTYPKKRGLQYVTRRCGAPGCTNTFSVLEGGCGLYSGKSGCTPTHGVLAVRAMKEAERELPR